MSLGHEPTATRPPRTRSRVSNGSALFVGDDIDERSAVARRYRDLLDDLTVHVGGDPTAAEEIIIRSAATLATWCEERAAELVSGKEIDVAKFTTSCNTLRRLLGDIGLERRAKDITDGLRASILRGRGQGTG